MTVGHDYHLLTVSVVVVLLAAIGGSSGTHTMWLPDSQWCFHPGESLAGVDSIANVG